MNARVFNALGLIRKEAGTKGKSYLDAWRDRLSKLPLIGKLYDPGVPRDDEFGGFPSPYDKMRYLQNQLDSGSPRWKTEEGKRSQAQFTGSRDGLYRGLAFGRDYRRKLLDDVERAQKRVDELSRMRPGDPGYPSTGILPATLKAYRDLAVKQEKYDDQREYDVAEGRETFTNQRGRWLTPFDDYFDRTYRVLHKLCPIHD